MITRPEGDGRAALRRRLLGLGLYLALSVWAAAAGAQALPPVIEAPSQPAATPLRVTIQGGTIEGADAAGIAVFRGLPYAAPPVGELRWRAPAPAEPWAGVRRAIAFGPACPQDRSMSIDQAGDPGPTAEDCLYLNVWSPPGQASAKRPVLLWIHGGALVIGAGSQSLFDGAALAGRGLVVVTFNYRLGALGTFAHPALAGADGKGPVNFGLLDQVAALRWVHDNIAAFGGDPGNVTLFGESAGAQSVLALFASPLARGLFRRGIAQSAYGLPSHTRAQAQAAAVALAAAAGLGGERATAEQLRALPAERLVGLATGKLSLAPSLVTGDAALPEPILAAFQAGREAPLPLIIGNNSDEASVAVAFGIDPAALVKRMGAARIAVRPLYPIDTSEASLGRQVVRDVVFSAYARRIAYLHSARAPTWRYYYSRLPTAAAKKAAGVGHGGEIAAVFGLDDSCACLPGPASDADLAAARRIGDYWASFAERGEPGSQAGPAWPHDGRRVARTLEFGDEAVVREDFMRRRLDAFIAGLKVLGLFAGRR